MESITKKAGQIFLGFLILLWSPSGAPGQEKPADEQCPQREFGEFSPWSQQSNLGPVINSSSDDYHPAISVNGLSLYFTSNRPGGFSQNEDIWVSQRSRIDAPWGRPQHLGPNVNSAFGTCCPNLSPDGHSLYFASDREGSTGSTYELWVSHRKNAHNDFGWEPPVNLGERIDTPADTSSGACAPTYFEHEETGITSLYFCRDHGGLGDFDIYVSTLRADGVFGHPALVWELNSPNRDTRTAIRRDGLEMFITSNRPGGFGAIDLWVSTRETTLDAWSAPVNLGPTLNTPANDGGPALSCDGTTMYFYSDGPGGFGGRDLYVTTRTKLEQE